MADNQHGSGIRVLMSARPGSSKSLAMRAMVAALQAGEPKVGGTLIVLDEHGTFTVVAKPPPPPLAAQRLLYYLLPRQSATQFSASRG